MSLNSLGFGIVFTASDLASSVVQGLAKKFQALDAGIEKTGLTMAGFGVAGLAAGIGLATSVADLDLRLREVGETTRSTAGDVAELSLVARKFAAAGVAPALEVVEAFRLLEKGGLTTKQALASLKPVMDLAAASFERLSSKEAAGLVAHLLATFPELAGNATLAADTLAKAVKETGLGYEDLGSALKVIERGAAAGTASLGDTLAALGAVKGQAGSAQLAVRSLAGVMERLAAAKTGDTLGGLVDVIDATTGKARPFLDVMGQLAMNLQGLSVDQRNLRLEQAFGLHSLQVLNPLLDEIAKRAREAGHGTLDFAAAIREMREQVAPAGGEAEAQAKVFWESWTGLGKQLSTAFGAIKTEAGNAFSAVLLPVMRVATKGVEILAGAIAHLPDGFKRWAAGSFLIGSLGAVVVGLGLAVKVVGGVILGALAPVLAGFAVLAAAGAMLLAAWENDFGGIRSTLLPVFDDVSLAVRSLYELFTKGEISGPLADELLRAENGPVLDFVNAMSQAKAEIMASWQELKPFFSGIATFFKDVWAAGLGSVVHGLLSMAKFLVGAFEAVAGAINGDLGLVSRGIALMVNQAIKPINYLTSSIADALELIAGHATAEAFRRNTHLDNYRPAQIAYALGGDEKDIADLEKDGPRIATARAARAEAGGSVGAPGDRGGAPSGVPDSRPMGDSSPAFSGLPEAIRRQIAALEAAASRPIVVTGRVDLDGERVGEIQARQERDAASRGGQPRYSRMD